MGKRTVDCTLILVIDKSLNVMCKRTADLTLILVIDKKFECNVQTDSGSYTNTCNR